jgi:hypothetical protein
MAKIIRPTYPLNFSIGLLLLIFLLSAFISFEIFDTTWHAVVGGEGPMLGMALAATAVVIMALILWEEFLFPVRIKPVEDEIIFRNHFTKLKTQMLIYCMIPAIVVFIYVSYNVSLVPFFIWATICTVVPVAGKLISGLKNYNDFLKFTDNTIEYKNNAKEGLILVSDIREIVLIKDEAHVLHKIKVLMSDKTELIIDLDEMELEAYFETIETFIVSHYGSLLR